MTKSIRIIGAIVDTKHLTLYKETGETVIINQGDPRLRQIIDQAMPQFAEKGWADVDIATQENAYSTFEKESNGIVKFFRVAKAKLKKYFNPSVENSIAICEETVKPISVQEMADKLSAIDTLIANAIPASDPKFNEEGVYVQGNVVDKSGETSKQAYEVDNAVDTIVALVDGKVIPSMEKIKSQFTAAKNLGSTVGMENFLKRLAKVIDKRNHSVEDLLKFLERADLPIANDGSIIVYKILTKSEGNTYVDCHTKKVNQFVGAFVCMDEKLVDPDRKRECSNGLHIARRGYLKQFNGNVCVLAKLAPEDVIAVPVYAANKMRVSGYHIIAELSEKHFNLVKQNKPITEDAAGKRLLANIINGKHIERTHEVRVTGSMGTSVECKKLSLHTPEANPNTSTVPKEVSALTNEVAVLDKLLSPKEVMASTTPSTVKDKAKPKSNAKVGKEVVKAIASMEQGSYSERIKNLLSLGTPTLEVSQKILELKRKSKKSWEVLGVPKRKAEIILATVEGKPSKKGA